MAAVEIGQEEFAADYQRLVEACEQGEKGKAKAKAKSAPKAGEVERLRPPNSLFYKLYPQNEKDAATETARRYWARLRGEEDGDEGARLASDEAMSGAFTALKFLHGDGPGAAVSSTAPAAAPGAAAAPEADAEALKRKLLEALDPEALGGAPPAAPQLQQGAVVEAFGLKGAPELNGRRGQLQAFDPATGRWQVDFDGAGPKKLKPENLRPAEAEPAPAPAKKPRCDGDSAAGDTTFL